MYDIRAALSCVVMNLVHSSLCMTSMTNAENMGNSDRKSSEAVTLVTVQWRRVGGSGSRNTVGGGGVKGGSLCVLGIWD